MDVFAAAPLMRTSVVIAVPSWMPSRFCGVEKALGSGKPSGVVFPVRYLSPLRLSIKMSLECIDVAVPHGGVGEAVKPCVIRDEADDAASAFVAGDLSITDDAALGDAEEADIEIIEALALWCRKARDGSR